MTVMTNSIKIIRLLYYSKIRCKNTQRSQKQNKNNIKRAKPIQKLTSKTNNLSIKHKIKYTTILLFLDKNVKAISHPFKIPTAKKVKQKSYFLTTGH